MRRTEVAASQVPVNDLIGPMNIVGGTPFCGMPIKFGATYGVTARDGEALDEQRKFGGRVTVRPRSNLPGGPRDYAFD